MPCFCPAIQQEIEFDDPDSTCPGSSWVMRPAPAGHQGDPAERARLGFNLSPRRAYDSLDDATYKKRRTIAVAETISCNRRGSVQDYDSLKRPSRSKVDQGLIDFCPLASWGRARCSPSSTRHSACPARGLGPQHLSSERSYSSANWS